MGKMRLQDDPEWKKGIKSTDKPELPVDNIGSKHELKLLKEIAYCAAGMKDSDNEKTLAIAKNGKDIYITK